MALITPKIKALDCFQSIGSVQICPIPSDLEECQIIGLAVLVSASYSFVDRINHWYWDVQLPPQFCRVIFHNLKNENGFGELVFSSTASKLWLHATGEINQGPFGYSFFFHHYICLPAPFWCYFKRPMCAPCRNLFFHSKWYYYSSDIWSLLWYCIWVSCRF